MLGLVFGLFLLLPACGTKSKTERMTAVVDDVRTKYKADEDISNEDQIFEAYDYFVKQKDYENAAPAALYSGCVRRFCSLFGAQSSRKHQRFGRLD